MGGRVRDGKAKRVKELLENFQSAEVFLRTFKHLLCRVAFRTNLMVRCAFGLPNSLLVRIQTDKTRQETQ